MAITYKTRGIILRAREAKGADRRYLIYTEGYGKIWALAKGVKKINSKLAGHLEPLTLSQLLIAQGQTDRLAGSATVQPFISLKQDLSRFPTAQFIVELLDKVTPLGLADQRVFAFFLGTLNWLSAHPTHALVNLAFVYKLFALLGWLPEPSKSMDLEKVVHYLTTQEYTEIVKLKLTPQLWPSLVRHTRQYLRYHCEAVLHTEEFLV